MPHTRTDISFDSGGETCRGWLFRPDGAQEPVPCVVMAHGLGALKEGRLDAFAERFAEDGIAALVFDYRHFGASDGEPRQLIDIGRQHADWRAALAHARTIEGIDPGRVALWGTSFSGGHVLHTAARDDGIAAVVSQVPHTSGPATVANAGPLRLARMTLAGLRDQVGAALGRSPHTIPIVGPPGSLAAMTSPDAEPGYSALYPPGLHWDNEVAARIALRIGTYSPGRDAKRIACPVLVVLASEDAVTPPGPARSAAEAAPQGELLEYECGHFEVYVGEWFERAVVDEGAFLHRVLL